jgi:hypothetical protein
VVLGRSGAGKARGEKRIAEADWRPCVRLLE